MPQIAEYNIIKAFLWHYNYTTSTDCICMYHVKPQWMWKPSRVVNVHICTGFLAFFNTYELCGVWDYRALQTRIKYFHVCSCIGTYCYQLIQYINSAFPCVHLHIWWCKKPSSLCWIGRRVSFTACTQKHNVFLTFNWKKGGMGDVACIKNAYL